MTKEKLEELKRGDEIYIRAQYVGHTKNFVICDIGGYNMLVYVKHENIFCPRQCREEYLAQKGEQDD